MVTTNTSHISLLLHRLAAGDQHAMQALVPLVYCELHRLAVHYMRNERKDHTLQPTALVHEAYLKLVNRQQANWQNKAHFFGVAAQVMRTILIDHARQRCRAKRGGVRQHKLSLDDVKFFSDERSDEVLALDESLRRLRAMDLRQSQIVELRVFGGLTVDEAAAVLGISPKTVKRDWAVARAWLYGELNGDYALNG